MSVTLSPTEVDVFTALRTVLIGILPSGIEVVRAEDNRVPEPKGSNFVVMSSTSRKRLATNIDTYADGYPQTPGARSILAKKQFVFQLDAHGPLSGDMAEIITAVFRDESGCAAFNGVNPAIQPLYCGDARQSPYQNPEDQYEFRYSIDVSLQVNTTISVGQDFASTVQVGLINVDVAYPPGAP